MKIRNVIPCKKDCREEKLEALFVGKIPAGFASPAADYLGDAIDLNQLIIKNKDYTFIGRVEGTSMIDASLKDGDIVVIDKSLEPKDNDKVLVCVDGEFTIKYVSVDKENQKVWLIPANADFPKIEVTKESDLRIWGVVTYSITKHRK
jgi:DNA polymerase V